MRRRRTSHRVAGAPPGVPPGISPMRGCRTQSPAFPAGSDPFDFPDPPVSVAALGPSPPTPRRFLSTHRTRGGQDCRAADCRVCRRRCSRSPLDAPGRSGPAGRGRRHRGRASCRRFRRGYAAANARQPDAAAQSSAETPPASGATAPSSPVEIGCCRRCPQGFRSRSFAEERPVRSAGGRRRSRAGSGAPAGRRRSAEGPGGRPVDSDERRAFSVHARGFHFTRHL